MRLSAEGIVVRYPASSRPALDGVSLDVPDGCLYAVLGPNGSGKSTLLKGLLGAIRVDSGRVLLDGRPISGWTRRERARAVGVVPQRESIAFPLTVREMVGMGRYPYLGPLGAERDRDRAAVREALERCDIAELADRDVATLSGGEFQRVRIARALAQEPAALVLDEPTASLDVRHEMAILELLRTSASRGMTVVLVTHGLELAGRFADRMLLLSRGRVAAEGAPPQVLRADVLEEVYRWPVEVGVDATTGAPRVIPLRLASRPPPAG